MSAQDIMSLLPVVILAGGILLILLLIAIKRHHARTFAFTIIILLSSLIASFFTMPVMPHALEDLFLIDRFGYYYLILITGTTIVVAIFSFLSLRSFYPEKRKEEFYPLLMIAALGSAMMAFSTHFISFFVSLEILSVALYALIAYYRVRLKAIEAGLKYLILAALSASFLLLGMALVYTISGTLDFASLAGFSIGPDPVSSLMLTAGIALMLVGIGFKLAAVPFHIWTPDVYEGASSPISAFIATVSKGSIVALLIRFFIMTDLYRFESIIWIFTIMSVFSMLVGNILALMQNNVKRILAYSSIAHFGYLLIALIAGKEIGTPAATFYLTTYVITILAAFGIITVFSQSDDEASSIRDYQGLFWKRPYLATAFTITLLSLAGIPLTAGFTGKFFVLSAGIGSAQWLLAITLVIGSVIGLYYYLRIIVMMMRQEERNISTADIQRISPLQAGGITLLVLSVLILWLGVWPQWLMDVLSEIKF